MAPNRPLAKKLRPPPAKHDHLSISVYRCSLMPHFGDGLFSCLASLRVPLFLLHSNRHPSAVFLEFKGLVYYESSLAQLVHVSPWRHRHWCEFIKRCVPLPLSSRAGIAWHRRPSFLCAEAWPVSKADRHLLFIDTNPVSGKTLGNVAERQNL